MKRNRYIASALALLCSTAILLSGCIKETFPQGGSVTLNQKQKPNFEDPSASLSAILIKNQIGGSTDHWNFGYPGLLTAFDHAAGEIIPQGLNVGYDRFFPWFLLHLNWMTSNSVTARFVYENYYKFIKVANETIQTATGVDAMKNELGMAKTYRALYYLDLARLYDPLPAKAPNRPEYETELQQVLGLTVPRSTETMIDLEEFENNPRMPRDEIFTLIFDDLNEAETLLADFTAPRKNVPSLAVVYGLKARAYLWLGGFTEAVGSHPVGNEAYRQAADYARKAINASGATMRIIPKLSSTSAMEFPQHPVPNLRMWDAAYAVHQNFLIATTEKTTVWESFFFF